MLISIKHDSVNGEIGIAPSFGDRERLAAENFKKQILRDPGYIPEGIGEDVQFDSFLAAFYLIPIDWVVAIMWVYRETEVLRKSLFFTTLKISLKAGQDPYSIAGAINDGTLKNEIRHAIRSGDFELKLEPSRNSFRLPVDPTGVHLDELASLPLLREVDIASSSGKPFKPFITFKPVKEQLKQDLDPRSFMDRSDAEVGQTITLNAAAPRQTSTLPGKIQEPAVRLSAPDTQAAPWFRDKKVLATVLLLAGLVSVGTNIYFFCLSFNAGKENLPPNRGRLDGTTELKKKLEEFEVRLKKVEHDPDTNSTPSGLARYLPIMNGPAGVPQLRSTPEARSGDNIICRLDREDKLEETESGTTSWLNVKVIESLPPVPQETQIDQISISRRCSKGDRGYVFARTLKVVN